MSTPSSRSVEFLKVALLAHRALTRWRWTADASHLYRCDVLARAESVVSDSTGKAIAMSFMWLTAYPWM